ncbi:hypothetical protein DVH24_023916 [Malus domestica]|uniref:Uncharacterized protein n=1 Tax=Malus domestica TaxID=3750 RepID=A0A498JKT0_MALDO|nr:hypothetical protein DVH24_023916 [Malus domestica]
MSQLIRSRKVMTTIPRPTITPPTAVVTASAEMDHMPVNSLVPESHRRRRLRLLRWHYLLVPDVISGAPALRSRCRHRDPQPMPRVHSQAMTDEVKNTVHNHLSVSILTFLMTNYNFDNINKDMLAYLNQLFSEQYKQWKSDLH